MYRISQNKRSRKGDMTETSEWSVSSADGTRSDFEDDSKIIQNFKAFKNKYNPITKKNKIIIKEKSKKKLTLNKKTKKRVNNKNLENISEHEPATLNKNERTSSKNGNIIEKRKENTGAMNDSATMKSPEKGTEKKINANILDSWFENKKKTQHSEELKEEKMEMPLINSWESSEEKSEKEEVNNIEENLEETKVYLLHLITEKLKSMGVKVIYSNTDLIY